MKFKNSILALGIIILANPLFGQKQQSMPADEIREVIQLAIDLPELQQYYHTDVDSTRIPLIIKEFGIINSQNMKGITKFGQEIVILTEEQIKKGNLKAYLNFREWRYEGNSLRIEMNYKIEGVGVAYHFLKQQGSWQMVDSDLWEE